MESSCRIVMTLKQKEQALLAAAEAKRMSAAASMPGQVQQADPGGQQMPLTQSASAPNTQTAPQSSNPGNGAPTHISLPTAVSSSAQGPPNGSNSPAQGMPSATGAATLGSMPATTTPTYPSSAYNTTVGASPTPYSMASAVSMQQANGQYKRPYEDAYAQNAKRPKTDGLQSPSTMGPPMSMGPPGTMGPPNTLQKKKDQGLDEGDPNDVFGGAGIDLQDEERNMTTFDVPVRQNGYPGQQSFMQQQMQQQQQNGGDRARRSDFLHHQALEYFLARRLAEAGVAKVEPEVLYLLSLATKDRLSSLLGQMVVLAKHRCAPPPKNGKALDDVGRVLKSISLSEAQDEERRRTIAAARRLEEETKRREAEEAASMSVTKKKPGVAKSLTEQALARNANATANMMLNQSGGKKYSWMTGAPNTSQLSRRNPVQSFNGIQPNVFKTGAEEHGSLITLKDFIAAIELEGEDIVGRGGKALLKAYTQLKD